MSRLEGGRAHLLTSVSEYPEYPESNSTEVAAWIQKTFSADCNIHGTIAFQEVTGKSLASFIHLTPSDADGKFDEIYQLMTEKWKVPPAHLILSVTGGAKNFDIDAEVLKNFKDIIYKISQTPGAWVVTGGTHSGVMKHVGDALRDESTAICVGIPTWGMVKDRNKLIAEDESHSRMFPYHVGAWLKGVGTYLDPNHTHFLLFDDCTEDKCGGEIKFRADFESYIVKEKKIPYVLIVLNGGPGTFTTICETIARGHKVILVKESGGVADFVANLIEGDESYLKTQKNLIQKLKDKLEDRFDTECETCKNNKDLFVIAQKEGEPSINEVVTKAILAANQEEGAVIPTINYLRLALLWHNPQILTNIIPINKPQKFISDLSDEKNIGEKICFKDLERVMIMALARGDVSFVKLLMSDYEIDFQDILTMDVLRLLYGYRSHEKNFPKTFAGLTQNDYDDLSGADAKKRKCYQEIYYWNPNMNFGDGRTCILKREAVCKLREKFMRKIKEPCSGSGCSGLGSCGDRKWFCCDDSGDEYSVVMCDPLWELFIWSCVCNLPDMAKYLWPFEGNQLAKSLIACNFWRELAEVESYSEQELESFRECKEAFGSLAYELLNECYKVDEEKAISLITTTLEQVPKSSCLDLALKFNNHDFVAHSCVQNVLTDVWTGQMETNGVTTTKDYLRLLIAIFLPFFIVKWFKFKPVEHRERSGGEDKVTILEKTNTIKTFYLNTPVVGFLLNVVFYALFLILYSYIILYEGIRGRKKSTNSTSNSTSTDSTDMSINTMDYMNVSPWEILLYIVVLGHLTTEIYQITQYDDITMGKKIGSWISDIYSYNSWDIFNLLLFIIAAILRFNAATSDVAHTLHAINCGFWIVRGTTALRVHQQFGQYYEMVTLMLADLINFFVLLGFITLAYGVFSTSVLYPEWSSNQPFLFIVMRPLFHIYGDFFVELEEEPYFTNQKQETYQTYHAYVVWIVMALYLAVTNIVLLNIIIAVFNNTYEEVRNKGKKVWRFNRYYLMIEYSKRVTLPPPLCLIQHTYIFIQWLFSICCKSKCSRLKEKLSKGPILNTELRRDISKLPEEEKVRLFQFECDRALHINKYNMELEEGKVVIKGLENDKSSASVTVEELEKNTNEIKNKIEDSTNLTTEGFEKNMTEMLEKNITELLQRNMMEIRKQITVLERSITEIKQVQAIPPSVSELEVSNIPSSDLQESK